MEQKTQNKSLLLEFLQHFEELPNSIINSLLKQSSNEDEKLIINSYSTTLKNQFTELSGLIKNTSSKVSKQHVTSIEQILKVSSGVTLVKDAKLLSQNVGSTISRIGISDIIHQIKKIIRIILVDILGLDPGAVDFWLEVLDELINILLSIGSFRLANTLSKMHQNYLAELTQFEKLKKASETSNNNEDEEEK